MLTRTVIPLVRPVGRTCISRILATCPVQVHQARGYAKNRWPSQSHPSSRQQSLQQKAESANQHSNTQPEHIPSADGGNNATPNADDVAASLKHSDPVSYSSRNAQSKGEEEVNSFSQRRSEANIEAEDVSPQQPLPDLTQGIPSTLDAELEQARRQQSGGQRLDDGNLNITEDPSRSDPANEGPDGPGDGLPKTSYVSSSDRKRQAQFKWGYIGIFASIGGAALYLGRNWDTAADEARHSDAPSGWSASAFYNRFTARLSDTLSFYNEPAFAKLLPDPDPDPALQPPFTLVLSLEDLLMHSEWSREHGWRIAKRPGVDYFLRYLSQYYELVVWTSQPMMNADPIIRKLDPFRIMRWPLFREATLYKNGEHVKDLSYLNRDLSKVLVIDTDPSHIRNQPENAIILPKWEGNPKDTGLVTLIPFLEYMAVMGLDDTRAVLKSFEGKDIPTEFAKREKIMREKFEAKIAAEHSKKPSFSLSSLGSAIGLQPPAQTEKPKMLWDQVRERGQKQYEAFDKEIRENGAKWLAEMEAEEKKAQEEAIKAGKSSLAGFFGSKS